MKTLKHTPGPLDVAENKLSVVTSDGTIVCHAKNNADAKLFAAAPELLEALILLRNANPNDSTFDYASAFAHADSIIKKATE